MKRKKQMTHYESGHMRTSYFENKVRYDSSRLRPKYILGLVVIALFVAIGFSWILFFITRHELDSHVINLAGRQRMLSQSLTKTALAFKMEENLSRKQKQLTQLRDVSKLWTETHRALRLGDPTKKIPKTENIELINKYDSIEQHHKAMLQATATLLKIPTNSRNQIAVKSTIDQAIDIITQNEGLYLLGMNEIVFKYDEIAERKVQVLKRNLIILLSLTLLVLILVGIFIFEPAARLLVSQFSEITTIAEERKKLVLKLQDALSDVKQLEGLLPICASCKKIRNNGGDWTILELYLERHSHAQFSHGVCPDCEDKLYPRPSRDEK